MSVFKKKNSLMIAACGLMLLAIGTCAISTMAWFTTSTYPANPVDIVSGSQSISVGEITGYRGVGSTGVETFVVGQVESTQNEHAGEDDWSFDIPNEGMGYYLVPANSEGQFLYGNTGTIKLIEYAQNNSDTGGNGTGDNVSSFAYTTTALTSGKKYQFRTYQSINNRTVNKPITINDVQQDGTIIDVSDENIYFTARSSDSFTFWVDYNRGNVGIESASFESEIHTAHKLGLKTPIRRNAATIDKSTSGKRLILLTNTHYNYDSNKWTNVYCHYQESDNSWTDWPGKQMSTLYTENGRPTLCLEVPTGIKTLVFNNGAGGNYNQTPDITDVSKDGYTLQGWKDNSYVDVDSWDVATTTYNFYNVYKTDVLYDTPYVYAYCDYGDLTVCNKSWPGAALTSGSSNVYSFTLPFYMNKVIFSDNGSNQTIGGDGVTLLTGQGGKYFGVTGGSAGSYTGTWYDDLTAPGSDTVYYFYDPEHVFGTSVNNHYCYWWNNESEYIHPTWPGEKMTAVSGEADLYQVTVKSGFNRLIFNNGVSGDGKLQTVDLSTNSTKKYYVLKNEKDGSTNNYNADLYKGLKSVSTTKKDYFVYDLNGLFKKTGLPYAYSYLVNSTSNDYFYKSPTYNATWPGEETTAQTTYTANDIIYTNITGLYKISVSEDFTHLIFNNGQNTTLPGGGANPDCVQMTDTAAELQSGKPYFVLNEDDREVVDGITKYGGTWAPSLGIVSFRAEYFLKDGESYERLDFSGVDLGKDVSSATASYNPENNTAVMTAVGNVNRYMKDEDLGIFYEFAPETNDWYKDNGDGTYTKLDIEVGNVAGVSTLVKRMICDVADMQTFYIDVSQTGSVEANQWQNINLYPWVNNTGCFASDLNSGKSSFGINNKIATNLYRVTIPKKLIGVTNNGFIVNNKGFVNGGNQTTDIDAGPATSFLYIVRNENNSANWFWCSERDNDIGTADIYVDGSKVASMSIGDVIHSNFFVYEKALDFRTGSDRSVNIQVTAKTNGSKRGLTTKTYGYSDLANNSLSFIGEGDNNNIIVSKGAWYTFYITNFNNDSHKSMISIAQVPSKGNGYYIMHADNANADAAHTDNFTDGLKMKTSEGMGLYSGFNVSDEDVTAGNNHLFFRSYLDAVDKPYIDIDVSRLTNDEANVSIATSDRDPAVVTLAAGKYTMQIVGETVIISAFQQEDFFYMDVPDASTGSPNIKQQRLSRVLEVAFTVNTTRSVTINLKVSNPLSEYIGCAFYVQKNKWGDDSFEGMREKATVDSVYTLSTGASLESGFEVEPNEGTTTYYAYILIDYITKEDIPSTPAGRISFALEAAQI